MSAHGADSHGPDLSSVIAETPRSVPGNVKLTGWVFVGIGLASAGFGLMNSPERTVASFIASFLHFFGLSQGALMFAVAMMLTQSRWGRPLKRIAEAFSLYTPVLWALLLIVLMAGGTQIYPWTHHEMPPHKAIYLQPGFFIARQAIGLGLLILLSLLFVRASLRADVGYAREKLGDRAPAIWNRLLGDWKGVEVEAEACVNRQMRLAPAIGIAYAWIFSMMAVDLSMSLDPHWSANMFPAWYFMSCVGAGLWAVGSGSLLMRRWLGLENILKPEVYHDLGKLNLGFTMFWAYTLFAQYLAIWYGNMTEEIGFVLVRTVLDPWHGLAKVVVICCFLAPFAMLTSRGLKKIKSAYLAVSMVFSIGLWLERHLVVMPSVWKETTLPIGPVEIGMALGMLGGLVLVVTKFLSIFPPVPLTDPWMAPNPADVHVHPSAHAH